MNATPTREEILARNAQVKPLQLDAIFALVEDVGKLGVQPTAQSAISPFARQARPGPVAKVSLPVANPCS